MLRSINVTLFAASEEIRYPTFSSMSVQANCHEHWKYTARGRRAWQRFYCINDRTIAARTTDQLSFLSQILPFNMKHLNTQSIETSLPALLLNRWQSSSSQNNWPTFLFNAIPAVSHESSEHVTKMNERVCQCHCLRYWARTNFPTFGGNSERMGEVGCSSPPIRYDPSYHPWD